MEKLLIISPHLSTGGCPQFVVKKIEMLQSQFDIYCVEYNFLSPHYVVQRNKIKNLLGDKFKSLGDYKYLLIDVIIDINPDIIFIEEISETFIEKEICDFIYRKDRKYKVIESTHGCDDRTNIKRFLPDKFIFVSEWSKRTYQHFNVPIDIIEYPIDKKIKDKNASIFDLEYKHVLNIGLFTPGKNQKYAFDIANEFKDEKIKFHFVGNLAPNFKDYWNPIISKKPDNCIIWGEKDNIQEFLQSSDLFLFTSKFELNPIVIKEALEFDIHIAMFNLETYCGKYENMKNISFLSGNLKNDVEKIKKILC